MSIKTIFIIAITVLVTVFLMLNNSPVEFNLIFTTQSVSKLVVIGLCFVCGFVVGLLVGRPKSKSAKEVLNPNIPKADSALNLTEEDKNYIS